MQSEEEMRVFLAISLANMLKKLPRKEQFEEMKDCERLVREAGIDPGDLPRDNPEKFANNLFLPNNPQMHPLVQQALDCLKADKNWDPENQELAHRDLDLLHSLRDGGVILPPLEKLPNDVANFRMQGVLVKTPGAECAPRIGLFDKLFGVSTEFGNAPEKTRVRDQESLALAKSMLYEALLGVRPFC
jgi:hypothetical protein